MPDRYTLHVTAPDAARGVGLAAQPNGIWLWVLGHAVNPSLVFLPPLARASAQPAGTRLAGLPGPELKTLRVLARAPLHGPLLTLDVSNARRKHRRR